jgi:hypothetical protein
MNADHDADRAPTRRPIFAMVKFSRDTEAHRGAQVAPSECLTCWARMPCTQHTPTHRNP